MVVVSWLVYLFFFYCYGDHRDLHSFPTRRSSDLGSGSSPWRRPPSRCGCCVACSRSRGPASTRDRKNTRLNSSHTVISYAVFCLKKKKNPQSPHCTKHRRNSRARRQRRPQPPPAP